MTQKFRNLFTVQIPVSDSKTSKNKTPDKKKEKFLKHTNMRLKISLFSVADARYTRLSYSSQNSIVETTLTLLFI